MSLTEGRLNSFVFFCFFRLKDNISINHWGRERERVRDKPRFDSIKLISIAEEKYDDTNDDDKLVPSWWLWNLTNLSTKEDFLIIRMWNLCIMIHSLDVFVSIFSRMKFEYFDFESLSPSLLASSSTSMVVLRSTSNRFP